jgi:hypothetical protein
MIVVLIVGILASMSVLLIDSSDERLKAESTKLFSLLRFTQDDAIINGVVHGMSLETRFLTKNSLEQKQYQFYNLQQGKWVLIKTSPLKPGMISQDIQIQVLSESSQSLTAKAAEMIYFLPSGEVSEFEIRLKNESDTQYVIASSLQDGLTLKKNTAL